MSVRDTARNVVRALVVLSVAGVTVAAAWFLFVRFPAAGPSLGDQLVRLAGVPVVVLAGLVGLRIGSNVATSLLPDYDVAEVSVEGPISRNQGGFPPSTGGTADDVVEQIERADADRNVDALIVHLNTPGGEVVPSEDIRLAAERFDGPTVAYATDTCASGGYWIASGCDEIWAREGSIVGSIGVLGSRFNVADLADRVGLSYEQLTAGEYKDAGMPLKELDEDEREYLQGIVDGYYDTFVDRVAEGREMAPEAVRETEARVYLGPEAEEIGLVDRIGTRREVEDALAAELDTDDVSVREFEPSRGLPDRLRGGAASVAYAFGAGVASVLGEEDTDVEFRV